MPGANSLSALHVLFRAIFAQPVLFANSSQNIVE